MRAKNRQRQLEQAVVRDVPAFGEKRWNRIAFQPWPFAGANNDELGLRPWLSQEPIHAVRLLFGLWCAKARQPRLLLLGARVAAAIGLLIEDAVRASEVLVARLRLSIIKRIQKVGSLAGHPLGARGHLLPRARLLRLSTKRRSRRLATSAGDQAEGIEHFCCRRAAAGCCRRIRLAREGIQIRHPPAAGWCLRVGGACGDSQNQSHAASRQHAGEPGRHDRTLRTEIRKAALQDEMSYIAGRNETTAAEPSQNGEHASRAVFLKLPVA